MDNWRDELCEAIKTKAEREAEEQARRDKRLAEALVVADEAQALGAEALRFAAERISDKGQAAAIGEVDGGRRLSLHGSTLELGLDRERAVVAVTVNGGRPREFDFANDRHIAAREVEDYVGRRIVELVRAVKKEHPW